MSEGSRKKDKDNEKINKHPKLSPPTHFLQKLGFPRKIHQSSPDTHKSSSEEGSDDHICNLLIFLFFNYKILLCRHIHKYSCLFNTAFFSNS